MFEVQKIEDAYEIETLRFRSFVRGCLYYREEVCCAPRVRFEVCRGCVRINPHLAAQTLFDKIKELAVKLFNSPVPEPDQLPLG